MSPATDSVEPKARTDASARPQPDVLLAQRTDLLATLTQLQGRLPAGLETSLQQLIQAWPKSGQPGETPPSQPNSSTSIPPSLTAGPSLKTLLSETWQQVMQKWPADSTLRQPLLQFQLNTQLQLFPARWNELPSSMQTQLQQQGIQAPLPQTLLSPAMLQRLGQTSEWLLQAVQQATTTDTSLLSNGLNTTESRLPGSLNSPLKQMVMTGANHSAPLVSAIQIQSMRQTLQPFLRESTAQHFDRTLGQWQSAVNAQPPLTTTIQELKWLGTPYLMISQQLSQSAGSSSVQSALIQPTFLSAGNPNATATDGDEQIHSPVSGGSVANSISGQGIASGTAQTSQRVASLTMKPDWQQLLQLIQQTTGGHRSTEQMSVGMRTVVNASQQWLQTLLTTLQTDSPVLNGMPVTSHGLIQHIQEMAAIFESLISGGIQATQGTTSSSPMPQFSDKHPLGALLNLLQGQMQQASPATQVLLEQLTTPLQQASQVEHWIRFLAHPLAGQTPYHQALQRWLVQQFTPNLHGDTASLLPAEMQESLQSALKFIGTPQDSPPQLASAPAVPQPQPMAVTPTMQLPLPATDPEQGNGWLGIRKNQSGSPGWQISLTLSLGSLGRIRCQAYLDIPDIGLQFTAERQTAVSKLHETMPIFEQRLSTLGLQVAGTQIRQGKVPEPEADLSNHANPMTNISIRI